MKRIKVWFAREPYHRSSGGRLFTKKPVKSIHSFWSGEAVRIKKDEWPDPNMKPGGGPKAYWMVLEEINEFGE